MSPPLPVWVTPAVVAVYGLLLGSFLNVVVHRLPRGQSVVTPRSRCPACGALIRWYHNLPLVSYAALGGRCAGCRAPISLRYPLLEAFAAASLLAVWWRFGISVSFFVFAPFALALVALFAIDLEHQLLPDAITKPGTLCGLAVSWWNVQLAHGDGSPRERMLDAAIGAIVGYGTLWLIAEGYYRLRKEDGLGGGDLKLAAMIGAFTGWKGALAVLLLASFGGVIVGVGLMLLRRADMKTALPLGCFLAPAALLVALVGAEPLWVNWRSAMLRLWGLPET